MSRTPNHPAGGPAPGGTPNPARIPATRPAPTQATTPAPVAKAAAAKTAAAPPAPTAAPAPPAAARPAWWQSRQNLIIAGSALGLILLVALFVWKPWAVNGPRLNSDPGEIARFAASSSMRRVPFEQQRQYMEVLDEKDKAVEKAYDEGRLTDQEYRRALQLAWYGDHLKKMDKFFAKPPTMRLAYLDSQVDKKIRKKKKKKADPKADDSAALTSDEIDRDDSTEAEDIKGWPGDVQQRWNEYRSAYASRKQFWKDYAKSHKGGPDKKGAEAKGAPETAPAQTAPAPTAEAVAPGDHPGAQ
jgi:hypothetical protein